MPQTSVFNGFFPSLIDELYKYHVGLIHFCYVTFAQVHDTGQLFLAHAYYYGSMVMICRILIEVFSYKYKNIGQPNKARICWTGAVAGVSLSYIHYISACVTALWICEHNVVWKDDQES